MRVHPALVRQVRWRRAGSPVFMWAALVGGSWWVLRLNDFPEHPLYSFFTGGQLAGDIDDLPPAWLTTTSGTAPLTAGERRQVLSLMRGLGPYGSEAGRPCDGDWCTCSILTGDYVARDA